MSGEREQNEKGRHARLKKPAALEILKANSRAGGVGRRAGKIFAPGAPSGLGLGAKCPHRRQMRG